MTDKEKLYIAEMALAAINNLSRVSNSTLQDAMVIADNALRKIGFDDWPASTATQHFCPSRNAWVDGKPEECEDCK